MWWTLHLRRAGLRTRLTSDAPMMQAALWSPDGRTMVYNSSRLGQWDLYRKSADGTGGEKLLYAFPWTASFSYT